MPTPRKKGKLLKGQLYDVQVGVITPTTKQVSNFDNAVGVDEQLTPETEIVVTDANASVVTEYGVPVTGPVLLGQQLDQSKGGLVYGFTQQSVAFEGSGGVPDLGSVSDIQPTQTHLSKVQIPVTPISGKVMLGQELNHEEGVATPYTLQFVGFTGNVGAGQLGDSTYLVEPDQSQSSKIKQYGLPNTGQLLKGQLLDRTFSVITPFTEQSVAFSGTGGVANLGEAYTEITPQTISSSLVKTFDITTWETAIAGIFNSRATRVAFRLPEVLTNLNIYYNQNTSEGADVHDGSGYSAGENWAFGLNLPGSATSSTSIVPELGQVIQRYFSHSVPAIEYQFFLTGAVTETAIITKLNTALSTTINPWPAFNPQQFSLVLFGQQISLAADVNAQQSVSASDTNTTFTRNQGAGHRVETGVTTKAIDFPEVLHGDIIVPNASVSITLHAEASAGWTGTGPDPFDRTTNSFPNLSVTSTAPAKTATASVQPSFLAATSPPAVPLFGLYLQDYKTQPYDFNTTMVLAYVVNMNYFGPSLSALAISTGTLYPVFAPSTLNYTATTNSSSMTVTPTSQESSYTIKVNGTTVTSGSASGSISLSVGLNRILIIVTFGNQTMTYNLVMTRTV